MSGIAMKVATNAARAKGEIFYNHGWTQMNTDENYAWSAAVSQTSCSNLNALRLALRAQPRSGRSF